MVSIAMIVLGVGLGVVGLAISAWPLTVVGAVWIVCGLISRAVAVRVNRARAHERAVAGAVVARDSTADPPARWAKVLMLTLSTLACGLSALAVGYFRLGFDAAHQSWRYLPLIAGIPPTALAVIGVLMYGIGSAAKATLGAPPTVPATIIVRSVHDTGVYVNNQPRLELDIEVRPEGLRPYRVAKKATVPFAALGQLEPGHGFHATVAGPGDPTNMDIDWASGFDTAAHAFDTGEHATDPATRLRHLDELHRQGLVTDTEYQTHRARIIGSV